MRPITHFAFYCIAAAALAAFAASSAAAAGHLTLGDIKGEIAANATQRGDTIEIHSLSFGKQAARPARGSDVTLKRGTTPQGADLGGWSKAEGLDVAWDHADARGPASGDMALKGSKIGQNSPTADPGPPDQGSFTVRARLSGCTPGRTFADAELTTADGQYWFEDLVITSCTAVPSGGASDELPVEEVSFNYSRVTTSPISGSKGPKAVTRCLSPSGQPQRC